MTNWVKLCTFLGVSAWGVTQLREGLERRKLSRYDSYSVTYYDTDDKYFREYPYRVNVSIVLYIIMNTVLLSAYSNVFVNFFYSVGKHLNKVYLKNKVVMLVWKKKFFFHYRLLFFCPLFHVISLLWSVEDSVANID